MPILLTCKWRPEHRGPWGSAESASSGGKSWVAKLFRVWGESEEDLQVVYMDKISKSGLISAWQGDTPGGTDPSLLAHLDGKTLCLSDFTTFYEQEAETVQTVLADLRQAFDGGLSKSTGVGQIKIESHVGLLTCGVMEVMEQFFMQDATMGQRILRAKARSTTRRQKRDFADFASDVGLTAPDWLPPLQSIVAREMDRAVKFLEEELLSDLSVLADIPPSWKWKANRLAELIARGRTVPKRWYSGKSDILNAEEEHSRLAIQLRILAWSKAALMHRSSWNAYDMVFLSRIARDSMPEPCRAVLKALYANSLPIKHSDLSIASGINNSGRVRSLMKQWQATETVQGDIYEVDARSSVSLTKDARTLLHDTGFWTPYIPEWL